MSVEQARARILQLEEAADRLACVRGHLVRNAQQVCDEVRGSVMRSMETLRSREAALLQQVAAVSSSKDEALARQEKCVHQAVSVLRKAVSVVDQNMGSEGHLKVTLDRLSKLDTSPEETPYIGFRVDNVKMQTHMETFGRVDPNGMPLAQAFQDPRSPSLSLPGHVEDYQDPEHHLFYKTLQQGPTSNTIKVTIPKLSQRPEDWLLPASKSLTNIAKSTLKSPPPASFSPSPSPLPTSHALRPSSLTQDTRSKKVSPSQSLDHWLHLIKHNAECEEEHNFEIVDRSTSQVTDPGLLQWLHPSSGNQTVSAAQTDLFAHIARDDRLWLSSVCAQLAKVQDSPRDIDMAGAIDSNTTTWLRSRAPMRQGGNPASDRGSHSDFFSHISKDRNQWLKNQTKPMTATQNRAETNQSPCTPNSQWLIPQPPIHTSPSPRLMTGDNQWLKASPVTPLNTPDSDNAPWLLQPTQPLMDTTTLVNLPTDQQESNHLRSQAAISAWLTRSCSQNLDDACLSLESLSLGGGTRENLSHDSEANYDDINDKNNDDDNNSKWLMPESQQQQQQNQQQQQLVVDIPKSSSVSSSNVASPHSDWLLLSCKGATPTAEEIAAFYGRDFTTESQSSGCDSWSVCSAPHSVSTQQHASDVATAQEYYNKWLL